MKKTVALTTIHPNPDNPRIIRDERFKQVCESIHNFPKMMRLRGIIVNKENMILGGNARYHACIALGYKEIPADWVTVAAELTPEEERRFIIEDNLLLGEWDYDRLANEWDEQALADWGLDYPAFLATDVPRPDVTGTDADKGKAINAKDGNWFYVEFYGQNETYGELIAALEDVGAMKSKHEMYNHVFCSAMELWLKKQADAKTN